VVDYYFVERLVGWSPSDVEQVIEPADCLVDIGPDRVTRAMRALGLYNKYLKLDLEKSKVMTKRECLNL